MDVDPDIRIECAVLGPKRVRGNRESSMSLSERVVRRRPVADGSIDLYFGLKSPAGKDKNWVQTLPGQGWMAWLRLYGPRQPWFDKSWRPREIPS